MPKLQVQQRISGILSAYDDLIENNRRRMTLLEEAARQLYREWFGRLRFPGHEHTRINDGVPDGWERRPLSDLADVNAESLSSSFDGQIEYVDIASVTPGEINATATYDFRDAPSRARRLVRHGDVIWSCVRPNRRSYAVVWQPPTNLVVSTGFAVLSPRSVPTAFLYFATTTDAFVGYLENHAEAQRTRPLSQVTSRELRCASLRGHCSPHSTTSLNQRFGKSTTSESRTKSSARLVTCSCRG